MLSWLLKPKRLLTAIDKRNHLITAGSGFVLDPVFLLPTGRKGFTMKYSYDLFNQHMPRNKLLSKGESSLSDVELLQVIIGSGSKDNDFKRIAKNLNALIQKVGIERLTVEDVRAIKGIGDSKAAQIFASLEFFRRKLIKQAAPLIDSPDKAAEQFSYICEKRQEYFSMLTLDGARRLIDKRTITVGTLMSSLVHPREVFAPAIEDRAASIIIGHNHPSGMLDISDQDREVTKRIKQAGELLGIHLDDHIIVSENGYVSAF